jgi:alpha-ribazole phosphatase
MARKLLLLRHGDVGEQYHDRYIGSTDISMSELGHQQIRAVKIWLHSHSIDCCYCSPMKRCREAAEIVLEQRNMECKVDQDLREIDFGQWEGLTFNEINRDFPDGVSKWNEFDSDFSFPDGERIGDFIKRIICFADRLEAESADTVLVCAHGGVIRLLICYFLGLNPWQYILFRVRHASVVTIELFDGAGMLSGLYEIDRPSEV